MDKGQLIDDSAECFADAALFGAAVYEAEGSWEDVISEGIYAEYSDNPPDGAADDVELSGWDDPDDRWDFFTGDLDDRMPYPEWDVSSRYRRTPMLRALLDQHPVKTWFDHDQLEPYLVEIPVSEVVEES
jgi:hypothetical protein